MIAPRLLAIVPAAQCQSPASGAQLAFDIGKLAAACAQCKVPWGLWLRDHGYSAATWRSVVGAMSHVAALGGSLGISAPIDGPAGLTAEGLQARGVVRIHVPQAAWPNWCQANLGEMAKVVAAHDTDFAASALASGADFVTLSPIWATESKVESVGLGPEALAALAQRCPGQVIALGGIDAATAAISLQAGAVAVASMTAWRREPRQLAVALHQTPQIAMPYQTK